MDKNSWAKGLLMLLVFCLFFGGWSYSNYQKNMEKYEVQTKEVKVEKSERSDLEESAWQIVSASEPEYGVRPELPPVPAVVYFPDGEADVTMRLKYIVQNHPESVVSERLNWLFESGNLAMNFQPQSGNTAQFGYMPMSPGAITTGPLAGKPFVPMFTVSPERLLEMETDEDVLFVMLVVHHEFQHYLQWERSTEQERVRNHAPIVVGTMTPNACLVQWHHEFEAYEAECELSNRWGGILEMRGFCDLVTNRSAFSAALTQVLMNGSFGGNEPVCHDVWAREGGTLY